jgi:hypothetical protein
MPRSNASFLGQLLGTSQKITASALDDSVSASLGGGSVTTYATAAALPLSGNTTGDQAFVSETSRLYIWTGAGWYNIALINTNPTITSGAEASYSLSMSGNPTIITLLANDPEGVPITWSHTVTTGSLTNGGGTSATVTQVGNEFTITPTTNQAHAGIFEITFTASDGVNLATSASTFTLSWFSGTGGTETTYTSDGVLYKVHTFTSSGTFTVTGTGEIEYLVVGGGGGGGNNGGGGGGGGGFLTNTLTIPGSDVCSVVIGSGGAGAIGGSSADPGTNGVSSSFSSANGAWSTIVAIGGGGGGSRGSVPGAVAGSGSSGGGGGASSQGDINFPGLGTAGQGFKGGGSNSLSSNGLTFEGDRGGNAAGGGGGGAGEAGQQGQYSPTISGGKGGDGIASSITGSSVYYAGGGGGGKVVNGNNGNGGLGGGGSPTLLPAAVNSGGGGFGTGGAFGYGGSGIVIIRYVI